MIPICRLNTLSEYQSSHVFCVELSCPSLEHLIECLRSCLTPSIWTLYFLLRSKYALAVCDWQTGLVFFIIVKFIRHVDLSKNIHIWIKPIYLHHRNRIQVEHSSSTRRSIYTSHWLDCAKQITITSVCSRVSVLYILLFRFFVGIAIWRIFVVDALAPSIVSVCALA